MHQFTTLRHATEKLLEAEYFLVRLPAAAALEFQFELNAFLSASRSVTFVIQKCFSEVPGFVEWYAAQRSAMSADAAMKFFLELRNVSQKQGPIALVGAGLPDGRWTYRFVGRPSSVPTALVGVDVAAGCATHLAKLASLVGRCAAEFPFYACPGRAFTLEGMEALQYTWRDVEAAVGLPSGYTDVPGISPEDRLRILANDIEPLDIDSINRIANREFQTNGVTVDFLYGASDGLVDGLADAFAASSTNPRDTYLAEIGKRIDLLDQ